MTVFSSWQVTSPLLQRDEAEQAALLKLQGQTFRYILTSAEIFTEAIGWTNPFAYWSFKLFWKASEMYYIAAFQPFVEGGT